MPGLWLEKHIPFGMMLPSDEEFSEDWNDQAVLQQAVLFEFRTWKNI